MSTRLKFHTWDNWQAVSKMTDREIGEELHAISKRAGREAIVSMDERYRLQCLSREAGDRLCRKGRSRGRRPRRQGDKMIEPTQADIGRAVVYTGNRHPGGKIEEGVITSFNSYAVFVRYGADKGSKGTNRTDLEWVRP